MESITISLNKSKLFDELVHNAPAEGRDLQVVTKDGAMETGKAAAVISFSVKIGEQVFQVQSVTSVNILISLGRALEAKYG